MNSTPLIKKASGEQEPFSPEKLEASLQRAGASNAAVESIVKDIQQWMKDGVTTQKIYSRAFSLLRKRRGGLAARYKLKKAIMELGPSGYPFEHFIGQVMKQQGFEVEVGQVVQGHCVQHEVDVVATNGQKQYLVECKFYNSQGKFASVQVPLYIRSRVDDIVKKRQGMPEYQHFSFQGWIVTNTRFTSDALDYGTCSGLNLLSWDYPRNNSLKDLIERGNIFPVTTLTRLTKKQKAHLAREGIVLCRQILENPKVLDPLSLTKNKREKLQEELEALCPDS